MSNKKHRKDRRESEIFGSGENVCCPYLLVLGCADTDEHQHLACRATIGEGPGLTNQMAKDWCLADFVNCLVRPRSEDGELVD